MRRRRACLPRVCPFSISPTTSKRLLRRRERTRWSLNSLLYMSGSRSQRYNHGWIAQGPEGPTASLSMPGRKTFYPLSEDNNSKSEKYWAGLFFPRMPFPIHDLISLRMASWMRFKFCQSHSNMAAGTAVMHFPSPRSTVKKEEPARRVHKIKADEVIIDTFGQRANCRAILRWKTLKVCHVVVHDDIFWSKI